jgi:Transposase IS66 family
VGEEKYDATSASMTALLKYGSGMPFHRLEVLPEQLEIPLPASTQWGSQKETAERIDPALEELIRQAAQGEPLYNDDTGMRVLALDTPDPPERKGGIYFGDHFHAGRTTRGIVLHWAAARRRESRGCAGPSCGGTRSADPDV